MSSRARSAVCHPIRVLGSEAIAVVPFCKLSSLILNRPLSESVVFPMVLQHFQQVVKLSSVGVEMHRALNCKCKPGDVGPLARARAGAGVGPAGHTFWHGNVHFHQVFKCYLLHTRYEANPFKNQRFFIDSAPKSAAAGARAAPPAKCRCLGRRPRAVPSGAATRGSACARCGIVRTVVARGPLCVAPPAPRGNIGNHCVFAASRRCCLGTRTPGLGLARFDGARRPAHQEGSWGNAPTAAVSIVWGPLHNFAEHAGGNG